MGFFNLVTQFPQVGVEVMHELASSLHADHHSGSPTLRGSCARLERAG